MAALILLALIAVPIAEIAVFIVVGERIGLVPTLLIVVLTAMLGTALMRAQGLATLRRAQASLDRHEFPIAEVFDGACLIFAGALLLTPGFITDVLGLLLFAPPVRATLRRLIGTWLQRSGRVQVWSEGEPPESGPVIEGDYRDLDDNSEPRRPKR